LLTTGRLSVPMQEPDPGAASRSAELRESITRGTENVFADSGCPNAAPIGRPNSAT